jgi:hypothetical protein
MDNADKQRHATQSNPAHTKLHLVLKLLLPLRCIATRLMESIRSCAVKLTVVLAFAGAMPSLGGRKRTRKSVFQEIKSKRVPSWK